MPGLLSPPKPPQIATRQDPAIANSRRQARFAEQKRRGRGSTIIADQSQLGDPPVNRPGARQTTLG